MSTGINELRSAINYLTAEIHRIFTQDLIGKIQSALDLIIAQIGSNGKLTLLIKKITDILNVNEPNITTMITEINRILKSIDDQKLKKLFSGLETLINTVNQKELIDNVCQVLKTVQSFQGLVETAKGLIEPAKILMYGAAGSLVGTALLKAVQIYLTNQKDQNLEKLVELNCEQTLLAIANLRQSGAANIMLYHIAKSFEVDFESDEQLVQISMQEARNILRITRPTTIASLQISRLVEERATNILAKIYQPELNLERIESVLDGITADLSEESWRSAVNYVIDSKHNVKPNFKRLELNYDTVVRLYSGIKKPIEAIMNGLTEKIKSDGGNLLYYRIANGWENGSELFSYIAPKIIQRILRGDRVSQTEKLNCAELGLENLEQPILEMVKAYSTSVDFVRSKWNEFNTNNTIDLSAEAIAVIMARAYIEYCKETVKYFFAPYNLYRESINGSKDVGYGIWSMIRHPINTVTNTVMLPINFVFNRNNTRTELSRCIWNHPVRLLTSVGLSSATGAAVGAAVHAAQAAHTVHAATMIRSMNFAGGMPATNAVGVSAYSAKIGAGIHIVQTATRMNNTEHLNKEEHEVFSLTDGGSSKENRSIVDKISFSEVHDNLLKETDRTIFEVVWNLLGDAGINHQKAIACNNFESKNTFLTSFSGARKSGSVPAREEPVRRVENDHNFSKNEKTSDRKWSTSSR